MTAPRSLPRQELRDSRNFRHTKGGLGWRSQGLLGEVRSQMRQGSAGAHLPLAVIAPDSGAAGSTVLALHLICTQPRAC